MQSDQELVRRVQEQDVQAFEVLAERYAPLLRRYLACLVRDDPAAEDLLQEVLLRVWTRAHQWSGQGLFKGWLYRIATNLALNHMRSQKRKPEEPLHLPDDASASGEGDDEAAEAYPAWIMDTSSAGPDVAVELAEQRALLRRLIEGLPAEKREAFRLVHQMDMSIRDAADELGVPEGTVKSRLYYAKSRLASQWQGLRSDGE